MRRAPAFQFYPADWLRDPQLRMATAATRGLWIDLLCHMWEAPERGTIAGTPAQIQRLLGCTEPELESFICEAEQLGFADIERYGVTDRNAKITVINRRMVREEKARASNAIRQSRFRHAESDATITPDVTVVSQACNDTKPGLGSRPLFSPLILPPLISPSPDPEEKEKQAKEKVPENRRVNTATRELEHWFTGSFVPAYPAHRRVQQKTAIARLKLLKPDAQARGAILSRLEAWKQSDDWTKENGEYVPGMGRFLSEAKYEAMPIRASPKPTADSYLTIEEYERRLS